MPTVEEAASLLRQREINMPQFIDPGFIGLQENVWTCDNCNVHRYENLLDTVWYVDYADGYVMYTIPAVATIFIRSDHVNNKYCI